MKELKPKWWQNGDPNVWSYFDTSNEDALTIEQMRKDWVVLNDCGNGIIIYQTPAGIYRVEEKADGTLVRLQLIEEIK